MRLVRVDLEKLPRRRAPRGAGRTAPPVRLVLVLDDGNRVDVRVGAAQIREQFLNRQFRRPGRGGLPRAGEPILLARGDPLGGRDQRGRRAEPRACDAKTQVRHLLNLRRLC